MYIFNWNWNHSFFDEAVLKSFYSAFLGKKRKKIREEKIQCTRFFAIILVANWDFWEIFRLYGHFHLKRWFLFDRLEHVLCHIPKLNINSIPSIFLLFLLFIHFSSSSSYMFCHWNDPLRAEFFYVTTIASLLDNGVQAPLFLQEPISELAFSNESGSQISCSAHGNPMPTVTWVQKDGSTIASVLGLRYINLTLK